MSRAILTEGMMSEIEFLRQEIAALRREVEQLRSSMTPYTPVTMPAVPMAPGFYPPYVGSPFTTCAVAVDATRPDTWSYNA